MTSFPPVDRRAARAETGLRTIFSSAIALGNAGPVPPRRCVAAALVGTVAVQLCDLVRILGVTMHLALSPIGPSISGLVSIIGVVVGVLALLLTIGVVGTFVVVVVANRADPDATNRRPFAVYCFGVSFVAVLTALLGSSTVVASIVQLIGSHPGVTGPAIHPVGDAVARGAVVGAIVTAISCALLVFHVPRGIALAESAAVRRVAQSYVAAVTFVAIGVGAVALGIAAYSVFQLIGPGTFAAPGRIPSVRHLIDALYVTAAAGAVIASHARLPVAPFGNREGGAAQRLES